MHGFCVFFNTNFLMWTWKTFPMVALLLLGTNLASAEKWKPESSFRKSSIIRYIQTKTVGDRQAIVARVEGSYKGKSTAILRTSVEAKPISSGWNGHFKEDIVLAFGDVLPNESKLEIIFGELSEMDRNGFLEGTPVRISAPSSRTIIINRSDGSADFRIQQEMVRIISAPTDREDLTSASGEKVAFMQLASETLPLPPPTDREIAPPTIEEIRNSNALYISLAAQTKREARTGVPTKRKPPATSQAETSRLELERKSLESHAPARTREQNTNWTVILLSLTLAGVFFLFFRTWLDLSNLRNRFSRVLDIEEERDRIKSERDRLKNEVNSQKEKWKSEFENTIAELEKLTAQLDHVRDTVEIESFGLFAPRYDLADSEAYQSKLSVVRDKQKALLRAKDAAKCSIKLTYEGSVVKGKQLTQRQLKLMLRAFNGDADAGIAKVRYNNLATTQERINRSWEAINKLGETSSCRITAQYRDLKLQELGLVFEHQEKLQEEKEEQRRIREEMREEEKARREIEQAQRESEREEERYNDALGQARKELEQASDKQKEKLINEIRELEKRLEEAHKNKERAMSRAQLTKSGHVYVISNIGSFGEDIYKIGMTRRLDPNDRINELGDASVPFKFDVHAMLYSENAPELENSLHKAFAEKRVNLVNDRREFFRVSLPEIHEIAKKSHNDIKFTLAAEAIEFRRTVAMRKELNGGVVQGGETASPALEEAKVMLEKLRNGA